MTNSAAKQQLALSIRHLHLEEDSFSIRNGHLVSKDGVMDYPVRKLIAIIPAHGTVMAVMSREQVDKEYGTASKIRFIGITLDEKKSFSFKLSTEAIGMPAKAIDKVWKKYSSPSVIVMLNNEGTAEKTMPVIGESSSVYPQAILHWRREHSAESERINALQQKISRYNADEIKALIREKSA